MNHLIVGGTSGLGLELATLLKNKGMVIVTGRHNPAISGITYKEFNLTPGAGLAETIDNFVDELPAVDSFIYAAGYYQKGTLTTLEDEDIRHMLSVGIHAPIWMLREILQRQGKLKEFIAITSTSQWTPRRLEPIYTATKAALGQFANSMAEDGRISKTMVVAPAGMKTEFWRMTKQDQSGYNDPKWAAGQIIKQLDGDFYYKFVRILREPPRTEIVETRQ